MPAARCWPQTSTPGCRQRRARSTPWRERIAEAIEARVAERDAAALIIALAIGDTQRVSVGAVARVQCGRHHAPGRHIRAACHAVLPVVRGAHRPVVGSLRAPAAMPAQAQLRSSGRLAGFTGLMRCWRAGRCRPSARLLMLATWHGLRMAARPRPAARTFASGLVGVLLLDPLAPLAAGFWLSFLAVGALLLQGALTPRVLHGWRGMLRTQGQVTAALVPVHDRGIWIGLDGGPGRQPAGDPGVQPAAGALGPGRHGGAGRLADSCHRAVQAGDVTDRPDVAGIARCRGEPIGVAACGAAHVVVSARGIAAVAVALLPWRPWMRVTALLALLPATVPASTSQLQGSLCGHGIRRRARPGRAGAHCEARAAV